MPKLSNRDIDAQIFMAIKTTPKGTMRLLKDFLRTLGLQYKWNKEHRNLQVWGPNLKISKKQIAYLRETYIVVKLRRYY